MLERVEYCIRSPIWRKVAMVSLRFSLAQTLQRIEKYLLGLKV